MSWMSDIKDEIERLLADDIWPKMISSFLLGYSIMIYTKSSEFLQYSLFDAVMTSVFVGVVPMALIYVLSRSWIELESFRSSENTPEKKIDDIGGLMIAMSLVCGTLIVLMHYYPPVEKILRQILENTLFGS